MRRTLLIVFFLFCVVCAAAGAGGYYWFKSQYFAAGPLTEDRIVLIERGTSGATIAAKLAADGYISNPTVFQYGNRIFGSQKPLRAGEFRVPAGSSAAEIAVILQEGEQVVYRITLPEGLTSTEMVDLLSDDPVLTGEIAAIPPEGSLLPETYHYHRGMTRQGILDRAAKAMDDTVDELWAARRQDLPLASKEELVILASIVEKETGVASERPLVASVFVNRLNKKMRLQSDPTVVYGITNGAGPLGRPLSRADLNAKTAYNTYQIDRLPPGPIANPGRASLTAVIDPPETKYLYFVADGSGGHAFAETLNQHNSNVRAWRKFQKAN